MLFTIAWKHCIAMFLKGGLLYYVKSSTYVPLKNASNSLYHEHRVEEILFADKQLIEETKVNS